MKTITYIVLLFALFGTLNLLGQSITAPISSVPFVINPSEPVKIIVDLTKCVKYKNLIGTQGPLYIWTWMPAGLPEGDPNANGKWNDSNEALKMTNEGNDKWSFTMIPTEFYKVIEDSVYSKDIHLLAKLDDGTGDMKTDDLWLKVDPAICKKMRSFPQSIADTTYITSDQPFSFLYDKTFETKANLVAATEYVVFARLWIEGVAAPVPFISPAQIMNNHPELEMTLMEGSSSRYQWTIIPSAFFKTKLDEYPGKKLMGVQIRAVVKKTSAPSNSDFTDEMTNFYFIHE